MVMEATATEGQIPEQHEESQSGSLTLQAEIARGLGATVEITGKWVWASFTEKPSKEARSTLKENKWIWCQNKGKWAWRGVKVSSRRTMPWEYIVGKYGCQTMAGSAVASAPAPDADMVLPW